MTGLVLYGFAPSVYTRVARIVLAEKGLGYTCSEVNPFDPDLDPVYRNLHPFTRVPVLVHDDFTLYETAAITRYLDTRPGPVLTPDDPRAAARMAQVIGIVDAYAYWPLVRQVFGHRVFRPLEGLAADETQVTEGLAAAAPVLAALDRIAGEGLVLTGDRFTLADCHLAPMIDAFAAAPEGAKALAGHQALAHWWEELGDRPSLAATDPGYGRTARPGRSSAAVC